MAAPYPMDLRKKVVEAYRRGAGTFASLAAQFMLGEATVNRWVSRDRKEGSPAPRPMGGVRRGAVGVAALGGEPVVAARSKPVVAAQSEEAKGGATRPRRGGLTSELSELQKEAYIEGAKALKGSDRRLFMARVVKSLGKGGQAQAMRELEWGRATIRKGLDELESGVRIKDNFSDRGRKKAEEHLPELLDHIRQIVEGQSQTDPTFRTTRMYTRLSARAVRQVLIDQFEYSDEELPAVGTIRRKLNVMGYRVRAVRKSQPKKNSLRPTPSSISSN